MSIKDWSVVADDNSDTPPNGFPEGMTLANLNNSARQVMADVRTLAASDTIAASSTTDIGSKDATFLTLTGTATTITALGTVSAGIYKFVIYNTDHSLTHNATSLILVGGASRTVSADNASMFLSLGSGNWREVFYTTGSSSYQPADATLTALAALNSTAGLVEQTGADTFTKREIGTSSGNIPVVGTKSATDTLAGLTELSNKTEAEDGTDNTTVLTPLRGAQAIAVQAQGADYDNATSGLAATTIKGAIDEIAADTGGGWVMVQSQNVSGSNIDFDLHEDVYGAWMFVISNVRPATDGDVILMYPGHSGGTFITTNFAGDFFGSMGTQQNWAVIGGSGINDGVGTVSDEGGSALVTIGGLNSTIAGGFMFESKATWLNGSTAPVIAHIRGYCNASTERLFDTVRFTATGSGFDTAGTITMYGLRRTA